MSVTVQLSEMELWQAAMVGVMRQIQALRVKSPEKAGASFERDWSAHVEGAAGELVVAKSLGVYWTGASRRAGRDVGGWSVRTRSRHDYDLIIRTCDSPEDKYVLVTGWSGVYQIRGWILGRDGMRDEWMHDYGNREAAYFVPSRDLHPWEDVIGLVQENDVCDETRC